MRKEFKLMLFYVVYLIATYVINYVSPSGPCTPGPGFFMFMLLIPISILLLLKDIFKCMRNPERSRLYCVLIHPAVWGILILLLWLNE